MVSLFSFLIRLLFSPIVFGLLLITFGLHLQNRLPYDPTPLLYYAKLKLEGKGESCLDLPESVWRRIPECAASADAERAE